MTQKPKLLNKKPSTEIVQCNGLKIKFYKPYTYSIDNWVLSKQPKNSKTKT